MRRSRIFFSTILDLDLELVGEIFHRHAFGERDELGDRRRRLDTRAQPDGRRAGRRSADAGPPAGTDGRRDGRAPVAGRGAPGVCGRTGCEGSGRGPPSGGRALGDIGRAAAGRALPAAARRACGAGGACCGRTTGRGGIGRAAGASPVSGSSMRRRRVGGTARGGARRLRGRDGRRRCGGATSGSGSGSGAGSGMTLDHRCGRRRLASRRRCGRLNDRLRGLDHGGSRRGRLLGRF